MGVWDLDRRTGEFSQIIFVWFNNLVYIQIFVNYFCCSKGATLSLM